MMLPGRRFPARFPASSATPNMVSESGASDSPASQRVVLEHDLQVERQHDHQPAERDLLKRLLRDPDREAA